MAANEPVVKKSSARSMKNELPPLSEMLNDSWLRLKSVGARVLGLYVLMMVVVLALFFGGMTAGSGVALVGAFLSGDLQSVLSRPDTWLNLGILFVLVMLVTTFIANAFTASIILAIDDNSTKTPFGTLLKRGFSLIVPLFAVSLITQLLVFGGLMLFVIPGIVIGILLCFAMYEVILGNARGLTALKNSVSIVSQNFWGILGRWAALLGVQIIVMALLSVLSGMESGIGSLFGMLYPIVNAFFALFSLVYGVLLYRSARANTNLTEGKMTWMWPVAILGWIVGGFVIFGMARVARSIYNEAKNNPEEFQRVMQEYRSEDDAFLYDGETNTGVDSESEYDALFNQIMEDNELSEEELNQLYDEALQLDQQSAQ